MRGGRAPVQQPRANTPEQIVTSRVPRACARSSALRTRADNGASTGSQPGMITGWLQAFANVQPITAMANSVRALLDGGSAGHWLWQSLAWATGIIVFFSILAVRQYRKV